jgi:nucleotide-binding universal stress UspA family protein
VHEILDAAGSWHANLIVLGSHGTGGYNDEAFGRTTEKVVNEAPCSVRIVQDLTSASLEKKGTNHEPLEESRFLLAVNDSANSKAMLENVLNNTWPSESRFQVLSVVQEPRRSDNSRLFKAPEISKAECAVFAKQKAAAEAHVEAAGRKLEEKFGKDKVTWHVLEGNVRSLILQVAQDWPADMILIGAHDHDKSILEHFLGSVAKAVVSNAMCSVEVVRH